MPELTQEQQREIFEKVAKLLSLADPSNNASPHERELAAKRAAQILKKYNLEYSENAGKPGSVREVTTLMWKLKNFKWMSVLRTGICEVFNCHSFTSTDGKNYAYTFVGAVNDLKMATFFNDELQKVIWTRCFMTHNLAGRSIEFSTDEERESYGLGFSIEIAERLSEMYKKMQEEPDSQDCMALVHIKQGAVTQYVQQKYPGLSKQENKAALGNSKKSELDALTLGRLHGRRHDIQTPHTRIKA